MPRHCQLLARLITVLPLLGGCTGAAFLAVNAPASFGPHDLSADLAYGADGRQQLDVYRPADPGAEPRPVVLFIHGGAWNSGDKRQYRFVADGLTREGFVAVLPNYRLNPAVRFPAFMQDAALAVAWTLRNIHQYGGDPRRVYIMGHSAGAHIALLLTLDQRYLAEVGVRAGDLRGAIGLSGAYDFRIDSDPLRAVFGSAPDPAETQPVTFVRGDAPPLLLIHGTDDWVCWDRHSIRLAELVRAAGGRAELRLYPGLGHGDTVRGFSWARPQGADTLADVAGFVAATGL